MSQQKNIEISERFTLLRKRAGSQPALARLLGITPDYVSSIETGKKTPGPRLLKDFEELERKFEQPMSVKPGVDRLMERADDVTVEEWRIRAIKAEERLDQLRSNIRAALSLSEAPFSSAPPSGAAELAKHAAGPPAPYRKS